MSFCNAYTSTIISNFKPKIVLENYFKDPIDIYRNSQCHNTKNHNKNSIRKIWKGENTWGIMFGDYFQVDTGKKC